MGKCPKNSELECELVQYAVNITILSAEKNKHTVSGLSQRFLVAMESVGYTGYRLAAEVDVISRATLTHIRKGRSEPSAKVLMAFLEKFPSVNGHWLLTGEGPPKNKITLDYDIEQPDYKKILHQVPVDEMIVYIQNHEVSRGFTKSDLYKMFLEIRMQRKLIEKMKDFEAKINELLKEKGKNGE